MRAGHWFALIGLITAVGMAQVAQRTAIYLKGYEIGEQLAKMHELNNDTRWLETEVTGLKAPGHLAHVMKSRRLELVAWSTAPMPSMDSHETRAAASLGD
jgi:hypothetical protein